MVLESDLTLRAVVDALPVGVIVWSADERLHFANRRAAEVLGRPVTPGISPAEAASSFRLMHAGTDLLYRESELPLHRALAGEVVAFQDSEVELPSGSRRAIEGWTAPVRGKGGKVEYAVTVFADISERRASEAIREGEARVLEMVAAEAPLAQALDTLARVFEIQAEGMLASILLLDGTRIRHGAGPSLADGWNKLVDGIVIGPAVGSCGTAMYLKQPVITEDIMTDERWVQGREAAATYGLRACWSVPIMGPDQTVLGSLAFYYHEPRRPTNRLLQLAVHASRVAAVAIQHTRHRLAIEDSEARARLIVEHALDANVLMGADGVITDWNTRAEAIFGWSAKEAVGRKLSTLIIPESMRLKHEEGLKRFMETGEGPILNRRLELMALHRRGHEFPVELSVTAIRRGDTVMFSGFIKDVTEQKRMEDEVRQLQKLEAIGRLSGGIAHDFNNILGVILGVGNMLLKDMIDPDKRAQVEEIVQAGERGANLTKQFLAFGRKQVLQPEVLDLGEVVRNLGSMLRRLIRENVVFRTAEDTDLWSVDADPGQIEQVVVNLAVNARDAMPHGGELLIETRNIVLDDAFIATHPTATRGEHVMLVVSDSGQGMDEATRNRIFEPFFTTKAAGHGTGLGLATVYGIVKQSGGYITVDSTPGLGSTFRIYLPRSRAPVPAASAERDEKRAPGRSLENLSILVVEDEPALRRTIERMLKRLKCRVTLASSGDQALALLERGQLKPDVLLTDVIMPGISGNILAARLRDTHPNLKVVRMSGYTEDLADPGPGEQAGLILQKPFTVNDLAEAIHRAVEAV